MASFAHLAGNHLSALDEGRRRQSSNFFEILNDPQRYHEQVLQFVNENLNDEDEESKDTGYGHSLNLQYKRLIRPSFQSLTLE